MQGYFGESIDKNFEYNSMKQMVVIFLRVEDIRCDVVSTMLDD